MDTTDVNNSNQTDVDKSNQILGGENTPKDKQTVENDLKGMSERLDSLLNGTESINTELEAMKEIIDKQNQVIEKQLKEMAELKKVNLQLANHDPNQKIMSTEEMLAKAFGA